MLEVRVEAANLVCRFRDGEITNDEFEDSFYPLYHRTRDRALLAIGTSIWCTYSDLREHRLLGMDPYTRSSFDRCVLFLRSGLAYRWERDCFIGIAGFSTILRRLYRAARQAAGRRQTGSISGPDSNADWEFWPFLNEQDFRRVEAELAAQDR
jgi:hypothetical protein